jgi:hypothetical protein
MRDQCQVFLSYASANHDVAERIESGLSLAGMRIWTDGTITPGEDWVSAVERGVKQSDVFVVLVGEDFPAAGLVMYELGFIVSEQRSRGGILLPVILAGAGDQMIPTYLRQFQMIDARAMGTDELVAAIAAIIATANMTKATALASSG